MQQQASSRWPRRLLIVALLVTLIGTILLVSSTGELDSIVDPRLNNEVEFQGTGTQIVNISSGCYRAISITGDADFEVTLTKLDGSARIGEALSNNNCLPDSQAMSFANQTDFKTIASWQVSESAEYALDIECSESADCQQQVGWFVSVDKIQYGMLGSKSLIIGTSMCLMGILLLPLSAILMAANKSKGKSKLMLVNTDGTLTPITNLNDAVIQQMNGGEVLQQNGNGGVAGPFADSPAIMGEAVSGPFADSGIGPQDGSFVDGTSDVQRGTMMTTDQVYALMRGDIEGASELFQDPFLTAKLEQTPSEKQQQIQQQENDILISSWDEGDSNTATKAPALTKPRNKKTPAMPIKNDETPEESGDSWKEWDEM